MFYFQKVAVDFSTSAFSLIKMFASKNSASKNFSKCYAWAVVGMLWCLCFLNYADRQVLSSVFPILEKEYALSKFQLGMIGSAFMWMYAAASFCAGYLTDRLKRKTLILTGCFFWSIVAVSTGWCASFWQFLSVRALEGLGESVYFPASNSMIADAHASHNRSKACGVHQSGVYFGTIAGSWVGAFLAQHYHWSYGFYFFGGLGTLLALVFFFFLKEPTRTASQNKIFIPLEDSCDVDESKNLPSQLGMLEVLSSLLRRPAVILSLLTFISANFVAGIFLTWLPTFLYEKFQMKLTMAGFYSVIFIQVASGLTIPLLGCLADRLALFLRHGRVVVQIVSLLLGSIAILMIGKTTTLSLLFVAMIFFGICKAGYDNGIFIALFDYIEPALRGSTIGLMNTFGWLGAACGPIVLGAIATYGGSQSSLIARMSSTISASACAYLLGAVFLSSILFLKKKIHRD